MKITKVRISNYLNLRDVELNFNEDRALVVGPNASGKTNILNCIAGILRQAVQGSLLALPSDYDYSKKPLAEIHFSLFPEEKMLLMEGRLMHIVEQINCLCERLQYHGPKQSSRNISVIDSRSGRGGEATDGGGDEEATDGDREVTDRDVAGRRKAELFRRRNGREKEILSQVLENIISKLLEILNPVNESMDDEISIICEDGISNLSIRFSNIQFPDNRNDEKQRIVQCLQEAFGKNILKEQITEFCQNQILSATSVDDLINDILDPERFLEIGGSYRDTSNSYRNTSNQRGGLRQTIYFDVRSRTLDDNQFWLLKMKWNSISTLNDAILQFLRNKECILPQSRGSLSGEEGEIFWNMNKAERTIINAYLSERDGEEDHLWQEFQEALLFITGQDIDVARGSSHFVKVSVSGLQQNEGSGDLRVVLRKCTKGKPKWRGLEACSGGERELIMVLSAVHLSGATNVFLDEPGHSLHPPKQAQLRRWLEERRRSGQVLFVITHSTEMISPGWLGSLHHMSPVEDGYTTSCIHEVRESKVDKKKANKSKRKAVTAQKPASTDDNSASHESIETNSTGEPPSKKRRLAENEAQSKKELDTSIVSFLMGAEMRRLFFSSGVIFVEGVTDQRVIRALRSVELKRVRKILEDDTSSPADWYEAQIETRMDRWDIIPMNGCADWLKAYSAAESLGIPFVIVLDADVLQQKRGSQLLAMTSEGWQKSLIRKKFSGSKYESKSDHPLAKMVDAIDELGRKRGGSSTRKELRECYLWVLEKNLEELLLNEAVVRQECLEDENFLEQFPYSHPEKRSGEHKTSGKQPKRLKKRPEEHKTSGKQPNIQKCLDKFKESYGEIEEEFQQLVDDGEKASNPQLISKLIERVMNKAGGVKQDLLNYTKTLTKHRDDGDDGDDGDEQYWQKVKKQLHEGQWKGISFELLEKMVQAIVHLEVGGRPNVDLENGLHGLWTYIKNHVITDNTKHPVPAHLYERKCKSLINKK